MGKGGHAAMNGYNIPGRTFLTGMLE